MQLDGFRNPGMFLCHTLRTAGIRQPIRRDLQNGSEKDMNIYCNP